jgi:predicted HAD superfamily Cof-like phosphohydrolase
MKEETPFTLSKAINHVRDFHDAFRLPVRVSPAIDLPVSEIELRFNLMKEENEEYLEAAKNGDIVEIADALGDMLYILCGTINAHGLQHKIAEVFEEIQRSNMSKLDDNGEPIYREDGKVMKSANYFKPDIRSILEK